MANKQKTVYICSECGSETPNWAGKCPSCGAWNTLAELRLDKAGGRVRDPGRTPKAKKLADLDSAEEYRALLEREQPEIALLVNAAGCGVFGPFAEKDLEK